MAEGRSGRYNALRFHRQRNALAMTKMMTTKFPLVVMLGGLSAQLQKRRMHLDLRWAPRDQNTDALTNLHFAAFGPRRRMEVDIENLQFLVWREMQEAAEELYESVQEIEEVQEGCQGELRVEAEVDEPDSEGKSALGLTFW